MARVDEEDLENAVASVLLRGRTFLLQIKGNLFEVV